MAALVYMYGIGNFLGEERKGAIVAEAVLGLVRSKYALSRPLL
jgi:hypothetical protein